ncbi:MAG: hypothetical protein WBS14_03775 [Rhodomicrobium sp.]
MTRVSLSRIAQTWGKLDFVVQPIAFVRSHLGQAGGRRPKGMIPDHHENLGLALHPTGAAC